MPLATVAHPFGPPVISGTEITVDTMLKQPTRITQVIMDLTLQNFIADDIYTSPGGVTGGAVLYDELTDNQLYTSRDVEFVAPGAEFPIVTGERSAPKLAPVEKFGGKFWISYEARDRNDVAAFTNLVRQLSNTIVRKINQRAIEVLDAAIASTGGATTFVGNDWSAAVPGGATPTTPALSPIGDLAAAQRLADVKELGVVFNLLLVNPVQASEMALYFGDRLNDVLASFGLRMKSSNRVPLGTAYFVAAGQVGGMRVEQPLATENFKDPFGRQRDWVQSSVRPVMYVTNPYSLIRVTGL